MSVIQMDEHQPHTVFVADGTIEIVPIKLLREVSNGNKPINALPDAVLQTIIREYLMFMQL